MNRLFGFLIIVLLLSCENENKEESVATSTENPISEVKISGDIKNRPANDSINKLKFYISDLLAEKSFKVEETTIDASGHFEASFFINRQQNITLSYKSIGVTLIVSPNDAIKLNFNDSYESDKALYNSVEISGTSEKINRNLFKFLANRDLDLSLYFDKLKNFNPDDYKVYHDSLFSSDSKYIDQFIVKNTLDDALKDWLFVERNYMPTDNLLGFPLYYGMFHPKEAQTATYNDTFYSDLKTLPKLKPSHLINTHINSFGNYLFFHYAKQVRKPGVVMTSKTQDSIVLRSVKNDYSDNKFLVQFTIYDRINTAFENKDIDVLTHEKEYIEALYRGSVFEPIIKNRTILVKNLLESPELPKKAELLTFKSNNPEDFLREIISNANGKVTYIDNWGTWCAPCRSEFEDATPNLKKRFAKDVEFVYICHLSDEKVWKSMISQYNLEGKHYFVTKEQTDILRTHLNITGYPTYNIINKKGDLLHSGFEYRPSLPEASKILDKLIK